MINYYYVNECIEDAQMIANIWLIPKDAVRPEDIRKRNGCKPGANK